MKAHEIISEKWSKKYKRSIDCSHPKGFSQRAHCQGRKKTNETEQDDLIYTIYVNGQAVVKHDSKETAERDVKQVKKKFPNTKIEIRTTPKKTVDEDNNGLSPSTKMFLEKEQSTQ